MFASCCVNALSHVFIRLNTSWNCTFKYVFFYIYREICQPKKRLRAGTAWCNSRVGWCWILSKPYQTGNLIQNFQWQVAWSVAWALSVCLSCEAYMAPESFEGYGRVKADIWAIGIITYEPWAICQSFVLEIKCIFEIVWMDSGSSWSSPLAFFNKILKMCSKKIQKVIVFKCIDVIFKTMKCNFHCMRSCTKFCRDICLSFVRFAFIRLICQCPVPWKTY